MRDTDADVWENASGAMSLAGRAGILAAGIEEMRKRL
jgi:hypothetical protein